MPGGSMDYSELIYNLLLEYLPGIGSALTSISNTVSDIALYVPELGDIRKFLLWFLVAFLSTKIIRWGNRV